ncbi:MAG: NAD(P)H-hydrate epimerase [Actinomycetota bacterium]|nr:NAD(P)H-hydrate epimerase [Actinomycetota bacterium]
MIGVRDVAQVRAAEVAAFAVTPEGALMERAAFALAVACAELLHGATGGVAGRRVMVMAGAGNNGGDALWSGAMLARRGCRVDAVIVADSVHDEGAAALRAAGGRVHRWSATDETVRTLVSRADLVIDGILGIGGHGGLRPAAAQLAEAASRSGAIVVAADLPSGVDADTGAVVGPAVDADVTVTFGALKPGLVVAPGAQHCGSVRIVDIGLAFHAPPTARVIESIDVARWVGEPAPDAYKYRRGVVGVAAGSATYPGAALLAVGSARRANAGMTRYLDRGDGVATAVVTRFPDVVVDGSPPSAQSRVDAWGCGPGFPGDSADHPAVMAVLAAPVPVVLDAGALGVAADDRVIRALIAERTASGLLTVLTPHDGELDRLQPGLLVSSPGRREAALAAAAALSCVVVLKGPGTIVAGPEAECWIDTEGTSDLGTAGSGDVLTGILAALLAGAWADGHRSASDLIEAVAAGVWLHGAAGRIAARHAPVVAPDLVRCLPAAVDKARFGDLAGDRS